MCSGHQVFSALNLRLKCSEQANLFSFILMRALFYPASGTEAATVPSKAAPVAKQNPPTSAGDREELTKDEILQKNREEFFKRHMKGGEKSR